MKRKTYCMLIENNFEGKKKTKKQQTNCKLNQ